MIHMHIVTIILLGLLLSFSNAIDTLTCPPFQSRESGGLVYFSQCPAYYLESYSVVNMTFNYSINGTNYTNSLGYYSLLNGTMGYCGTPPLAQDNQLLPSSETLTMLHHIEIILPIPWCYASFLGFQCGVTGGSWNPYYPDYFGPSIVFNERPIQTQCRGLYGQASNSSFIPPNIPLWDNAFSGQTTLGTIRIAINDSCAFNTTLQRSMIGFQWILNNGTVSFPNMSGSAPEFINNITSTSSVQNYFYGAYGKVYSGTFDGTWCNNGCDTFIKPTCSDNVRTSEKRATFRSRAIVSLACKDPSNGFGFVWRVDNTYGTNQHFDWYLYDQINGNFLLPVATNDTVVNKTLWNYQRNLGFNDTLYNGFWTGVAGKRRVFSGYYFYIPTYAPNGNVTSTSRTRDPLLRPTILDLYAGYPSHYVGSTILAGIVDFFDMRTILKMSTFIEFNTTIVGIQSPTSNATYADKNLTTTVKFNSSTMDLYIPKDYDRQVILTVCTRTSNLTATLIEIVSITNVSGWVGLCNHIINNSKTWAETLTMLYNQFPGILASPSSDPVPVCNCSNLLRSPCGNNLTGQPSMMSLYPPPTTSLTVNASIFPVCKVNQTFLNFINKTTQGSGFLIFIYNATQKSGGDYGYIWAIENLNINSSVIQPGLTAQYTTTQNDLYAKWAFGTYSPPSGNANSTYPLPYPLPSGVETYMDSNGTITSYNTHDVTIRSGTRYYFFSLTSDPHKMYGTFQQACSTSCSSTFPNDPPILDSPYGWSIAYNSTQLLDLPDCICSENVPCDRGSFVFNVNLDANLSAYVAVDPPPLPPLNYAVIYSDCIPTVEECNGIDDDCDGIIDNILGYNTVCDYIPGLNGTGACSSGLLACPVYSSMIPSNVNFTLNPELSSYYKSIKYKPVCYGGILPKEEECNLIDDNCDGIIDNILPYPCGGYYLGTCKRGIITCVSGVSTCIGNIDPIPEICGDGLDNDCDGIIDNGCGNTNPKKIVITNSNFKPKQTEKLKITFSEMKGSGNQVSLFSSDLLNNSDNAPFYIYANDLLSDVVSYTSSFYLTILSYIMTILVLCCCLGLLCAIGPFGACSNILGFLPAKPWVPVYDETEEENEVNNENS